jgi:hypothetical protein
MYGAGHHPFARARLAADQRVDAARRELADALVDLDHARVAPDERIEPERFRLAFPGPTGLLSACDGRRTDGAATRAAPAIGSA